MNLPSGITAETLTNLGVTAFGVMAAADVVFSGELREGCNPDQCASYGKSWACPPSVGTFEQCRARCLEYSRALMISSVYELEDSFDFEAMAEGGRDFKRISQQLHAALTEPHLMLSNGKCGLCDPCAYPGAPCRFPEKCLHSLSGYGIYVSATAKRAGLKYNNGENTVTYFAVVFW